MSDPTTNDRAANDRDPLDEAIDRTVRDMTHAAADDRAVARVMARVREASRREAGPRAADGRWMWMPSPRVAWSGVLAVLLMMLLSRYSWHPMHRDAEGTRVAVTAPAQSPTQPQPLAAREFPTPVVTAPSTTQATARITRRDGTVTPASVANVAADASERRARAMRDARSEPALAPLESDIELASITPAPLGDAPPIDVAPLITSSLTVDEIPLSSIDMPPVSPEPQK
jgi:hypothetical protein